MASHEDYLYEGYKTVIRKKPPYDPFSEYIVFKEFIEEEKYIYIVYEVRGREDELNEIVKEEINKE